MARRIPPATQHELFAAPRAPVTEIAPEVVLLASFVATAPLREAIDGFAAVAPFRHLATPNGGRMSVAMTNCGTVGWWSDARGYRYVEEDPLTGRRWPPLPASFATLAAAAAERAGFPGFAPDCCLVNRYAVGAQMGAHRDHDELDLSHPIVSVSIGLPAVFVWHGARRQDPPRPVVVRDGDVMVFGGGARAGYHAVRRVRAPVGSGADAVRYNLTFRRAR